MVYLSKSIPLFLASILKPVFCSVLKKLEWQRILWISFACACRSIIHRSFTPEPADLSACYIFYLLFRPNSYNSKTECIPTCSFFVCIYFPNSSWAWTILRQKMAATHSNVHSKPGEQCCGSGSVELNSYVFESPGSGSISQRYGSGSGSFDHQANIVRKNIDSYCVVTSLRLFIFKKMM